MRYNYSAYKLSIFNTRQNSGFNLLQENLHRLNWSEKIMTIYSPSKVKPAWHLHCSRPHLQSSTLLSKGKDLHSAQLNVQSRVSHSTSLASWTAAGQYCTNTHLLIWEEGRYNVCIKLACEIHVGQDNSGTHVHVALFPGSPHHVMFYKITLHHPLCYSITDVSVHVCLYSVTVTSSTKQVLQTQEIIAGE